MDTKLSHLIFYNRGMRSVNIQAHDAMLSPNVERNSHVPNTNRGLPMPTRRQQKNLMCKHQTLISTIQSPMFNLTIC